MESFWNKDKQNLRQFQKIENDIKADVCIIGGGLTGLNVGYYLSKNKNVVIVEKDTICEHTSGLTTGKITSQHGLFYDYLINSNCKEFAKRYLEANEEAINNIENIVKEENIECDFERESSYVFTQSEDEVEKILKEQKAVQEIAKGKSNVVDKIDLPLKIKKAIEFTNQAKFHPVKFAYGISECILKNNGKIYENSKATDIKKENGKYVVQVNGNKVITNYIVIATRYPFISIPGYYFLKMYQSTSYAIVADVKEELFKGYYINSEIPTKSFRVIKDNDRKLLLAVGYDYKTGTDQTEDGYKELEKTVKQMYPKAEILYKWTAEDCISLDKIPYIGEYSKLMPNVYIATGFNKWGMTSSNIAANIISDKILNKENKYEKIFKSTRMQPIKNRQEVKNMLKQTNKSLITSRFKIPKETLKDIKNGEAKIVEVNNKKVGVYKTEKGEIYKVSPYCSHLGCELYFNNIDKIWECPCHGSKFSYEGKSLEMPSNKDLKSNT